MSSSSSSQSSSSWDYTNQYFPNKYKGILDIYPRYFNSESKDPYLTDKCCDYFCCFVCSPFVIPIWLVCCFGVTGKKTIKACKKCCVKTNEIVENEPTKL